MSAGLRELAEELAGAGNPPDPLALLREARARGLPVRRDDLTPFLKRGYPEVFVCPSFIPAFLCSYLTTRASPPDVLLDLWGAAGLMLPPLVEGLAPGRAIGLVGTPYQLQFVEFFHTIAPIEWRVGSPEESLEDREFLERLEPGLDVLLGIPPWRWQPRYVTLSTDGETVILCDDPANVSILRASSLLRSNGIGFFIVGPGFIMRPGRQTVFPNLHRFGVHLEALVQLPRGVFSPDTGTGRLLLVVGREERAKPLVGRLTDDPDDARRLAEEAGALRTCGDRRSQEQGAERW